jgi:hypothetical protein
MVHPLQPTDLDASAAASAVEDRLGVDGDTAAAAAEHLVQAHQRLQSLARADAEQIERLKAQCGADIPYVEVPFFDEDIHDVRGLMRVSSSLVPSLEESHVAPAAG